MQLHYIVIYDTEKGEFILVGSNDAYVQDEEQVFVNGTVAINFGPEFRHSTDEEKMGIDQEVYGTVLDGIRAMNDWSGRIHYYYPPTKP